MPEIPHLVYSHSSSNLWCCCNKTAFWLWVNSSLFAQIHCISFIHSSAGHLGYYHFLAIVHNTAGTKMRCILDMLASSLLAAHSGV